MTSLAASAIENREEKRGTVAKLLGRASLASTLQAEGNGLPWLGFRVFKWLILVVFVLLGLIALWAWLTYPDVSRYLPNGQVATAEQAQAWTTAHGAWVTSVKDVGQIFLLTPVFPLIGAVIGYIFGRNITPSSPGDDPNKPVQGPSATSAPEESKAQQPTSSNGQQQTGSNGQKQTAPSGPKPAKGSGKP